MEKELIKIRQEQQEQKEMFAEAMRRQEESHKETLKNHKIIMAMIDKAMEK